MPCAMPGAFSLTAAVLRAGRGQEPHETGGLLRSGATASPNFVISPNASFISGTAGLEMYSA
jgi:hypothetical protein